MTAEWKKVFQVQCGMIRNLFGEITEAVLASRFMSHELFQGMVIFVNNYTL